MVIIQHDFLCGFCDCMGGAESLEKRYIERSEDTLMKTPKLKYSVKRFVAASLCAGMLFTDVGNGILFETNSTRYPTELSLINSFPSTCTFSVRLDTK